MQQPQRDNAPHTLQTLTYPYLGQSPSAGAPPSDWQQGTHLPETIQGPYSQSQELTQWTLPGPFLMPFYPPPGVATTSLLRGPVDEAAPAQVTNSSTA